jgi:hypothetical protein
MSGPRKAGNREIYLVQPKFPPSYWGLESMLRLTPFRAVNAPQPKHTNLNLGIVLWFHRETNGCKRSVGLFLVSSDQGECKNPFPN